MARPWRLRHKLLLGLALMVAILGTLLAGSLLGLDSYIATTKTTDSKLAELQAVGCDIGQGFYLARPMTTTALGELLDTAFDVCAGRG